MSVTPAYEGWFQNADGSFTLLVGYFNRNAKETLDIPIGPNNRIEPGGPDMGQPTHFGLRRGWGVFTIRVPKDFGTKKYTWTIVSNGRSQSIPIGLTKGYQVEPYRDAAMGNEPPKIKFEEKGKDFVGPPIGIAATYTATTGQPLTLATWVADPMSKEEEEAEKMAAAARGGRGGAGRGGAAPAGRGGDPAAGRGNDAAAARGGEGRGTAPLRLSWHQFRGPGAVTFAEAAPKIDGAAAGKATTTATFSAPGEYILRVQVNDRTGDGGGGFQCCWTNAHVKVTVTGAATTK